MVFDCEEEDLQVFSNRDFDQRFVSGFSGFQRCGQFGQSAGPHRHHCVGGEDKCRAVCDRVVARIEKFWWWCSGASSCTQCCKNGGEEGRSDGCVVVHAVSFAVKSWPNAHIYIIGALRLWRQFVLCVKKAKPLTKAPRDVVWNVRKRLPPALDRPQKRQARRVFACCHAPGQLSSKFVECCAKLKFDFSTPGRKREK